jgi:hypothetical protein
VSWEDALEIVVAQTKVERYRHLCSDANTLRPPNDRDAWRAYMIRKAANEQTPVSPHNRAAGVSIGCCGQILPK